MEYPLIDENEDFPRDYICPICRKKQITEPNNYIVLQGGAIISGKEGDSIFPEDVTGFLELIWHGRDDDNIVYENEVNSCLLPLARDSSDGQFGFYFCSTTCLRDFFMTIVDDLEAKKSKKRLEAIV
jgi:hypothetical protein